MSEQKREEPKAAPIQWDTEERNDLLSAPEGHIRDTTIYITAPLWKEMQDAWGGVVSHVKTSTEVPSGEVTVFKADPKESGAVAVRQWGALNTAEFSFFRPLRKLNLKLPASRQFNVTPFTREVTGVGTLFVFPMANRVSVPRNRKEEAAAGGQQQQKQAEIAATEPEQKR